MSMLYVSLVVSGLLLIAANLAVRGRHPVAGTIGACVIAVVGPAFLMLGLPAVLIQAVLLVAALPVLLVPGRGRRLYVPASVLATLAAYGYTAWSVNERQERLREQFPVESMVDRLPTRSPTGKPSPADPDRLESHEQLIEKETGFLASMRDRTLERLHEDKVGQFVNSYGFGVGRMSGMGDYALRRGQRDGPPVPQPGLGPDRSPPDRWEPVVGSHFDSLHEASVMDFVNPAGFGLVRDRTQVFGFQKHGFSKVPDPADAWKVGTIDLVGLLLHPEPVAYVSANLPRMDELRDAPTRPLDPFEAEGLELLRGGEELFARGSDKRARMLGAVRSTKQCLACHGGDRGDLLGAFSYTLRRGD
ncbi:MAG TPA: hypothetical protein VM597_31255 [Gemmataceae bacterium]|nr:hypothetical protein [Gemmataceae bacterium]